MKKSLPLALATLALVACHTATTPAPTGSTPNAAASSDPNRLLAQIPELNLYYTYDSTVFQEPEPLESKVILYRQGEAIAGAGTLAFTFHGLGKQPEYETWLSDFPAELVASSSLQTLCNNERLSKEIIVQCRILRDPVPHAEFYVAMKMRNGSYTLHKSAVFYTGVPAYPGLYIDTFIEDAPADLLAANNDTEARGALEKFAKGEAKSRLVTEFDRVINSIETRLNR